MAVFEGSRYANAAVIRTEGRDGRKRPTIYGMAYPGGGTVSFRYYVTHPGDRFDTLAAVFWDDPEQWWRIANLNPEVLCPDDLEPGTTIRIPF